MPSKKNKNHPKNDVPYKPTEDPKSPLHKKKTMSHVFKGDLKDVMEHGVAKKIRERYETHTTPHEKELIDYMLGQMTEPLQVAHFFLGGHIELQNDDAQAYDKWMHDFKESKTDRHGKVFPGPLKVRSSSHVSHGAEQGSFNGPVISHVLFSTRKTNPDDPKSTRYTWVQLENSPIKSVKEWNWRSPAAVLYEIRSAISHLLDFFKYRITQRNIGAYGTSEHTEKTPLKIDVSKVDQNNVKERAELWKKIIIDYRGMNLEPLMGEMKKVGIKFPVDNSYTPA